MGRSKADEKRKREERQNGERRQQKKGKGAKAADAGCAASLEVKGDPGEQGVNGNTDGGAGRDEKGERKKSGKKEKVGKVLRKAVKAAIRERSSEIANSLIDTTTIDGDLHGVEMLLSLAKKKKDEDDDEHDGMSAVELLGSEEQWEDELPIATVGTREVGQGGREPENSSF
jgi:hypothetical protein